MYLARLSHSHQPIYKPDGRIQMSEEEFMNTVVREMLNGTIPDDVIYGGIYDGKNRRTYPPERHIEKEV